VHGAGNFSLESHRSLSLLAKLSKILAEERDSVGTNLDLFALRARSDWSIYRASTHGQHVGSHCELRTSRRRLFQDVCIHLCLWLVAPIAREKDSFPYGHCDMEENIVTIHTEAGTALVSISYVFQSFREM
jgi:hypothetical protein